MRDAFHQAAVADENVGPMIDDFVTGLIELRGEQPFGERHPDGVGEPLSQRTGRRLHARRRRRPRDGPASSSAAAGSA